MSQVFMCYAAILYMYVQICICPNVCTTYTVAAFFTGSIMALFQLTSQLL